MESHFSSHTIVDWSFKPQMRPAIRQYNVRNDARWIVRFLRASFVLGCLACVWFVTHVTPGFHNPGLARGDIDRGGIERKSVLIDAKVTRDIIPHVRPSAALAVATSAVDSQFLLSDAGDSGIGTCAKQVASEFGGHVVKWGSDHIKASSAECCAACRESIHGCNVWVWCSSPSGCGSQKFGECWLKKQENAALAYGTPLLHRVPWISGGFYTKEQAAKAKGVLKDIEREHIARRDAKGNSLVYLDVSINDAPAKRIEFILYTTISPLAAENFRLMCLGEPEPKYTWVGATFYRILDKFIDQTGVNAVASAVNPGKKFNDDEGGLKLKHDRVGLLSLANAGPNTNHGHFSIVMAPAPHLDGKYPIFGEVVSGIDHAWAINDLATLSGTPAGEARITAAGVLKTL